MAYFDPSKKSILLVDASLVGLGGMLTQGSKQSDLLRQQSPLESGKALLLNQAQGIGNCLGL